MTGIPVVTPINPYTLSFDDTMKVIESANMIKDNICGEIKGRICADNSNKKRYLKEGESFINYSVFGRIILYINN